MFQFFHIPNEYYNNNAIKVEENIFTITGIIESVREQSPYMLSAAYTDYNIKSIVQELVVIRSIKKS